MASDIELLDQLWSSLDDGYNSLLVDERVSKIMRGPFVAHRFALLTQLAGTHLDATRNVLALQSGAGIVGSWDPRSFASKVVVPWLRDHRSPLGNSGDPYVSNPLRRPTVSPAPDGVKKSTLPYWKDLYDVLQEANADRKILETRFLEVVAIVRRLLDEQDKPLVLPDRVSPQIVLEAVDRFLLDPSGGDRALAVSWAIFKILIAPLIGIETVTRATINASDSAAGSLGDIVCSDFAGAPVLVVEVKERSLSLEDVRSSLEKVRDTDLGRYVFASPMVERVDSERIGEVSQISFERNLRSCHFVSVASLLASSLLMHDEGASIKIIKAIEESLTEYNTQPANRTAWRDLISDLV